METTYTWDDIMRVEDSLQEAGIFVNGMTGRTCHSDSYMTAVEYPKLDAWFAAWKVNRNFEKGLIEHCIAYWKTNPNMQPPLRLVAMTLERYLNK